jgi:hypothetical protein
MEAVVLLTLGGFGYLLSRARPAAVAAAVMAPVDPGEVPSVNSVYDATYVMEARRQEVRAARARAEQARRPAATGVVPRAYKALEGGDHDYWSSMTAGPYAPQGAGGGGGGWHSELAGVQLGTRFLDANVQPYFRGSVKQVSLDVAGGNGRLEAFTGTTPQGEAARAPKTERAPLFRAQPQNTFGAPMVDTAELRDRLVAPFSHKNVLPFEQQRVGPAINGGYTTTPGDGYMTGREFQMPLDTDALRVATNPKTTYAGRTVAGSAPIKARGLQGSVETRAPASRASPTCSARRAPT